MTPDPITVSDAQARFGTAEAAVQDLQRRLRAGDVTVTGAEVAAAQQDVEACQLLLDGAQERARAAQDQALAEKRREAFDTLHQVHAQTRQAVADVLGPAREALGSLVDACVAHQQSTGQQLQALGRAASGDPALATQVRNGTLPGVVKAAPAEVVRALVAEIMDSRGQPTDELYLGTLLEVLGPFA